jgi:tetratricopeptide (TPR) repeat protein
MAWPLAQRAFADTIVLKNGKRIFASSVVESGDKVKYLTSSGELSLPKSIVDHIEKGGSAPLADAAPAAAASLTITPPNVELGGAAAAEIENAAIRDNAIDRDYLSRLDSEARFGATAANQAAALAHHAASLFELARGDIDKAVIDERRALTYSPQDPGLLMNMAFLYLRRSEYKQAMDYLDRAQRVAPEHPDLPKLKGWAFYGTNKLDQAVAEWKRALAVHPDAEVRSALEKAQRDLQEEQSYKENESSHFMLRYSGAAEPALARAILRTLESHFSTIESQLNFTPTESIGVVLYTQQAFADITRAPGWVGALNDGRIRVPVQGLTDLTPELSRVLKHELTHSFVQQKTLGRAPVWVQEGIAQWMEGKRSNENASFLTQIYEQKHAWKLGKLEASWMKLRGNEAEYAYAWALANIEYIIQVDGMVDVERILDRLARGSSTEAALRDALHSDYDELMASTVQYLHKTYGR